MGKKNWSQTGHGVKSTINSSDPGSPLLVLRLKNMTKERIEERNGLVIASIIGMAALMATSGVALAEGGGTSHVGINGDIQVKTGMMIQGRPSIQGVSDDDQDGHPDSGEGSDENQLHKDNGQSGTNPMFENKDRMMQASSTHMRDNNEDNGQRDHNVSTSGDKGKGEEMGKGGIRAFFSWILGLPASTTVGDIRAQIAATTTASASHSEGLGFWARIFGAFHFGGGKDN